MASPTLPPGWSKVPQKVQPQSGGTSLPPGWQKTAPTEAQSVAPSPMSWLDVPGQAIANLPGSALQFGKDVAQPFMHPIETGKALGNLAVGTAQMAIPGEQGSEQYPKAVWDFMVQRYGGIDQLKKTMATDPVGFLSDASIILSGGGALATKMGLPAKALKTAGRATNPVVAVSNVAKNTAKYGVAMATAQGPKVVEEIFRAAQAGGPVSEKMFAQMRNTASVEDIVSAARGAMHQLQMDLSARYVNNMGKLGGMRPLDFTAIDRAMGRVQGIGRYGNKITNPSAVKTWQAIEDVINEYRNSDPSFYHTPLGLDAMKKRIGDIADTIPLDQKPSRLVAQRAMEAIRNTIIAEAPQYADYMKDYERGANLINEMERGLSLNKRASVDTAARKLLSIMRNNANTNFGYRAELGDKLSAAGGRGNALLPMLAGRTMDTWLPRGLQRYTTAPMTGLAAMQNPALLPLLPMMSPRLMGEATAAAGQASRVAAPLVRGAQTVAPYAFQVGRATDEERLARARQFR